MTKTLSDQAYLPYHDSSVADTAYLPLAQSINSGLSREDKFLLLKKKVLTLQPAFKKILRNHGATTLHEYTKSIYLNAKTSPRTKRTELAISAVHDEIARVLGTSVARRAQTQLHTYPIADTADHSGTLNSTTFFNGHLLTLLAYQEIHDPILKDMIVLSCSNNSFDTSTFPRGFQYHSVTNNTLQMNQLTFLGRAVDPRPILFHAGYTQDALHLIQKRLITLVNERIITKHDGQILETLTQEIFSRDDILRCDTYADQLTKINYLFFQKLSERLGITDINYVNIEQERVTLRLLTHHLYNDTLIHRIMFDPSFESLVIKYFHDIKGAFSENAGFGTYLFWGMPENSKYRVQLWKDGNSLVSSDKTFRVELTPDAIAHALFENKLIPSLLLTFSTLAFYHGLQVLGGFSQVNYLTSMKESYSGLTKEVGDSESATVCKEIATDNLFLMYQTLNMLSHDDNLVPATAMDLFLHAAPDAQSAMRRTARSLTVEKALLRAFPTRYNRLYKNDSLEGLSHFTDEDVNDIFDIKKDLHPVGVING
ncbi:MAG: hypothetical protein RLZZ455_855 [Candidatus Parcubacteria bacterium]|jgi:hypothetical protein